MDLPRSGISLSEHCSYTAFSVTPCFYLASHTGGSKILHRPLRCWGRHQDHWPHPGGISQLENSNRFYISIIPWIPFMHINLLGVNSKTLPKRIEYGSVLSHICIKVINFDIWYISLHFRWIKEPGYLQEYIQFITIPKNYNYQKNMGLNIHVLKFNSLKLHRGWYMYIKVQAYLHRWALHLTRYRLPDRWFCVWPVLFHWSHTQGYTCMWPRLQRRTSSPRSTPNHWEWGMMEVHIQ